MAHTIELESYTVEVPVTDNGREAERAARFVLLEAGIVTEPFPVAVVGLHTSNGYEVTFAGINVFDRAIVRVTGYNRYQKIEAENEAVEAVEHPMRFLERNTTLKPNLYGVQSTEETNPAGVVTWIFTFALSAELDRELTEAGR